MRVPIAVALLALVAAPALAQPAVVGSETRVDFAIPEPVRPGETTVRPVDVTYDWDAGAANPTEPTRVELSTTASFAGLDGWAVVDIAPQALTFQPDGQDGQQTKQANLTLAVAEDAPAEVPANVTVTARAEQNGAIAASEGEASRDLLAELVPGLTVRTPDAVEVGGAARVDVDVRSRSNGPIAVRLADVAVPDGIGARVPGPVVLGPGGPVQDRADDLPVDEARRDRLKAPSEATLTVEVDGRGSGDLAFVVVYGPVDGPEAARIPATVRIVDVGTGLVPVAAGMLAAAAVVVGYLWLRDEPSGPQVTAGTHPERSHVREEE